MNPIDVIQYAIFKDSLRSDRISTPQQLSAVVWAALVEHGEVRWMPPSERRAGHCVFADIKREEDIEERVLVLPMPEEPNDA